MGFLFFLMPQNLKLPSPQVLILKKAQQWAQDFFTQATKKGILIPGGHGFDHNQRVAGLSLKLSQMEKKDPFLPILTSLIFDVGRTSNDPSSRTWRHGKISRQIATPFINSLSLNDEHKQLVLNAIEDHPKLNKDVRRNYLSEIIMDADRLDTIGALGVIRSAAHRWKLPLYSKKTPKSSKDDKIITIFQDFAIRAVEFEQMFWTKSAHILAKKRIQYLKQFIKQFKKEADQIYEYFDQVGI